MLRIDITNHAMPRASLRWFERSLISFSSVGLALICSISDPYGADPFLD